MPLLRLETNATLPPDRRQDLMQSLSRLVAETIGKPEQYVMVVCASADIRMSGQAGEAAFVDLRSIGGLTGEVNRALSQKICRLLRESLGLAPERVFLSFTDVKASHWGWNGTTLG